MIGIYSKGIANIPFLESFLQDEVVLNPKSMERITCIAGWGEKGTSQVAKQVAQKYKLPYLSLEDGFIRSVGLGVLGIPQLSMIIDPIGIYYDSTRPSLLENILNDDNPVPTDILHQAKVAIDFIKNNKISKYNSATSSFSAASNGKLNILIVDQTMNDMSVQLGNASSDTFNKMYHDVLEQYPNENIYIKKHPDVIAGIKRGYFDSIDLSDRVIVIDKDMNPLDVIQSMDHIYVVTSQLGFEALLFDKKVTCYGTPFYSSWGITEDKAPCSRRRNRRSVLEVFAVAYLMYTRYISPETGISCSLIDVLKYIHDTMSIEGNKKMNYCVHNLETWKRNYVRPFLTTNEAVIDFMSKGNKSFSHKSATQHIRWGYSPIEAANNSNIWYMEDGFYRSVGLGSNYHLPLSLVIDRLGIYYNPQRPSQLEEILNNSQFYDFELEEARKVQDFIIEHNLTKYNVDSDIELKISNFENKKVIFVPGQVADDASIQLGCVGIVRSIEELLMKVRNDYPDAFIIYKPHPDVLSKNRNGVGMLSNITNICDHIEDQASIINCIRVSDEIHTLTSQTGFDALIRRKKVVTYGAPFYAGWGLTEDKVTLPNRRRVLSVEELIAGVLIKYPTYYNRQLNHRTDCMSTLRRLVAEKQKEKSKLQLFYQNNSKVRFIRKYIHWMNEWTRRGQR